MRWDSKRRYHFIYKTTCLETGKYYVGMHSTDDLDDGYLGSGRRLKNSVKKYGTEKHKREILEQFDTREKLCEREEELVTSSLLQDPLCMNISTGGLGGFFEHTSEAREKMRRAKLGKKQSPEMIAARREGLTGHSVSEQTREKLRRAACEQWSRRYSGDGNAIGRRRS